EHFNTAGLRRHQHLIERQALRSSPTLGETATARMVDKDAPDHLRAQRQEMGPVLAADSTTLQKLQIRLVRQSHGFEALARFRPCELFSRDPPQFRINDGDHPVQRFRTAVVPCRQHSGDIVVALCRHADRNPIKKDHLALTVPPPVRGIQSRNIRRIQMSKTNQTTAAELQSRINRRKFLSSLGAAPTLTAVAGAAGLLSSPSAFAETGPNGPQRRQQAFVIRRDTAIYQRDVPQTPSISNGDDEAYANRIASFTKGLPHNDLGEVDLNAYSAYLQALNSGKSEDFEAIPLGGAAKLSNPQAAYCFALEGADAAALASPPAPAFSSAQAAAEMVEDSWQGLARDVP